MSRYLRLLTILAAISWSTAVAQSPALSADQAESIRRMATSGDPNAQYMVGFWYSKGIGVRKNDAEAAKWYRLAAEQGLAAAQFVLGMKYADGEGVATSYVEAVKWYRLAADQGHANAQSFLGLMYAKGEGVPESAVDAYFWWNLAAAQGVADAKTNKAIIEKEMSREQIAEAQRRSAAWKPKTRTP